MDLNAAAAARRAGYRGRGTGYRLSKHPEVQLAIRSAISKRANKMMLKQEAVVKELQAVAFSEASDASGAKVKLGSKLRALELLGKHLGMFQKGQEEPEEVVIVDDL